MSRVSTVPKSEEGEVARLCLTLCDPMDCSLPGSSIHGVFQARILERVAISCLHCRQTLYRLSHQESAVPGTKQMF